MLFLSLPFLHFRVPESQIKPLEMSQGCETRSQGSCNWPAHIKQQGQSDRGTLTHVFTEPLPSIGKGLHVGTDEAQLHCCPLTKVVTKEPNNSPKNITLLVWISHAMFITIFWYFNRPNSYHPSYIFSVWFGSNPHALCKSQYVFCVFTYIISNLLSFVSIKR